MKEYTLFLLRMSLVSLLNASTPLITKNPEYHHLSSTIDQPFQTALHQQLKLTDSIRFDESKNEIVALQQSIDWVHRYSKTFLPSRNFEPGSIESIANPEIRSGLLKLENRLVHHVGWAKRFPESKDLTTQLTFMKHVCCVVFTSLEEIERYENAGTYSYLIRCIIQTNLRLLAMHNSRGEPFIDDFTQEELMKYKGYLETWKSMFLNLTDPPLSVSLLFESQFTQVEKSIRYLESHMGETDLQR